MFSRADSAAEAKATEPAAWPSHPVPFAALVRDRVISSWIPVTHYLTLCNLTIHSSRLRFVA